MADVDIVVGMANEAYEDVVSILMPYCNASAKEAGIKELRPKHKLLKKAYDSGKLEVLYIFNWDMFVGYAIVVPHEDLLTDRVYANVLSLYVVPSQRRYLKTMMYKMRETVSNLFPAATHLRFAIPTKKRKFGHPADIVCIMDVE